MIRLLGRRPAPPRTVGELRRLVTRKQREVATALAHPGTVVDSKLADVLHRLDRLESSVVQAVGEHEPTTHMLSEWSDLARTRVVRRSPARGRS